MSVTFKFAQASNLITGDRITGFPSYVEAGHSIVIDPLPQGLDTVAMQAAINRRAADLASIAQALGLASSQLSEAISALAPAS
nr:hypothetical protein [uncultured Lichenicoccus sp.]